MMEQQEILIEKVRAIEDLLKIQRNVCVNDYQVGVYNGLAVALSVLTGEPPQLINLDKGGQKNGNS